MTARLRLFRVIVLEFRGHKKNSLLNVVPWHNQCSTIPSFRCCSPLLSTLGPLVAFFHHPPLPPHQTEPSRLELVIVANYKGDSGGPVKQNRSLSIEH